MYTISCRINKIESQYIQTNVMSLFLGFYCRNYMFRAFPAHHQESLNSVGSRWDKKQVRGRAMWRPVFSPRWQCFTLHWLSRN
jgi:hypothetical protein